MAFGIDDVLPDRESGMMQKRITLIYFLILLSSTILSKI
jgi:hypothetical protein